MVSRPWFTPISPTFVPIVTGSSFESVWPYEQESTPPPPNQSTLAICAPPGPTSTGQSESIALPSDGALRALSSNSNEPTAGATFESTSPGSARFKPPRRRSPNISSLKLAHSTRFGPKSRDPSPLNQPASFAHTPPPVSVSSFSGGTDMWSELRHSCAAELHQRSSAGSTPPFSPNLASPLM